VWSRKPRSLRAPKICRHGRASKGPRCTRLTRRGSRRGGNRWWEQSQGWTMAQRAFVTCKCCNERQRKSPQQSQAKQVERPRTSWERSTGREGSCGEEERGERQRGGSALAQPARPCRFSPCTAAVMASAVCASLGTAQRRGYGKPQGSGKLFAATIIPGRVHARFTA